MANTQMTPGIVAGRLSSEQAAERFSDLHPPLAGHEASVAADRCYFCHDAPCITACPTEIDIPLFIRQIQTGTPEAAAKTILGQNILGGMCARVCPTETLCEQACVREAAEGKPVEIGRLQRFATDVVMETGTHPFERATSTGKRVGVVGAGPAGLACAHRLAMHGHDVVIFERTAIAGGLNEFGIAAYKSTDGFAAREVDWLMQIGGIELRTGQLLGDDLELAKLRSDFDAVFLSIGLGGVNALQAEGVSLEGVRDAVDFISELRQAPDVTRLPIGRDVVVVGGGMTAVDAAVQSKLLGAQNVTIVYRRGRERMSASRYEQDLATSKGVRIVTDAQPVRIEGNGAVNSAVFEYTSGGTGEQFSLQADQVLMAIGQKMDEMADRPALEGGKIKVTETGATSVPGIWAGGDCATGGDDLTVTAVAEGRDAAEDIHSTLMGGN